MSFVPRTKPTWIEGVGGPAAPCNRLLWRGVDVDHSACVMEQGNAPLSDRRHNKHVDGRSHRHLPWFRLTRYLCRRPNAFLPPASPNFRYTANKWRFTLGISQPPFLFRFGDRFFQLFIVMEAGKCRVSTIFSWEFIFGVSSITILQQHFVYK